MGPVLSGQNFQRQELGIKLDCMQNVVSISRSWLMIKEIFPRMAT